MHCPNFSIVRFGHFKASRITPESWEARSAVVTDNYELEFYYANYPGGLTINGTRYQAKAGAFACCKPGQMRKFNLPYRCYFFNLSTKDPELTTLLDNLPDYATLQDSEKILALCEQMNTVTAITSTEGQLQVAGLICMILGILAQQLYMLPGSISHSTLLHQKALVAANAYLREHLTEDIDLNKLAKAANLHPTYFHKLFTAAYNNTPTQILYLHRVLAAQTYLQDAEMTIAEIAEECGFSSQSFFSSKFKEVTGSTPSRYRNNARRLKTKNNR